jgi:hypothetical protein
VREVEFTKLHVADYTDHEEVIREANRAGTASSLLPTETDIVTTDMDLNTGLVDDSGMWSKEAPCFFIIILIFYGFGDDVALVFYVNFSYFTSIY